MSSLRFISKLSAGFSGGMFLLSLLLYGTINQELLNRDKNGTSGGTQKSNGSQTTYSQEVTSHCSLYAERGGFEPPVPLPGHSISSAAQSATLPPLRVSPCQTKSRCFEVQFRSGNLTFCCTLLEGFFSVFNHFQRF